MLDLSRSMEFGTVGYSKAEYARTLIATLALFLNRQRDAVGLVTFDERVRDVLPARYRPGHFRQILIHLERATQGTDTQASQALVQAASNFRKRGMVLIISDFLLPIEPLKKPLAYLRSWGHEVLALRVLDPAERQLKIEAPAQIVDIETGRRIYVDPLQASASYRQRFEAHAGQLRDLCNSLGVDLAEMTTDQPLEMVLTRWLALQSQRRGTSLSHRRPSGRTTGGAS